MKQSVTVYFVPGLCNIHGTYFVVICLAKEFQYANMILDYTFCMYL